MQQGNAEPSLPLKPAAMGGTSAFLNERSGDYSLQPGLSPAFHGLFASSHTAALCQDADSPTPLGVMTPAHTGIVGGCTLAG